MIAALATGREALGPIAELSYLWFLRESLQDTYLVQMAVARAGESLETKVWMVLLSQGMHRNLVLGSDGACTGNTVHCGMTAIS